MLDDALDIAQSVIEELSQQDDDAMEIDGGSTEEKDKQE